MIGMKIEFANDKIIIYLYNYKLHISNIDLLNNEIKNIIIKLIKKYCLNFFGYSQVTIYSNKKYGNIIEIENISLNDFYSKTIDLKIIVYKNVSMYLEIEDYYFDEIPKNIIIKGNHYYFNLDSLDNLLKYIEYGKIKYEINN